MGRTVTLILIDGEGALRGALPPFGVPDPWWQLMESVVSEAKARFGLELTVLRILSAEREQPPSGAVTYLAEPSRGALGPAEALELSPVPAALVERALGREPLRAPWAMPGGPAASLAWARARLAELGHADVGAEQHRSWNLSSIWRLHSRDASGRRATTWLKEVPAFFAHEAAVLRWLGERVPGAAVPVLAADGRGRALLGHVQGEDAYGCGVAERDRFASILHRVQTTSLEHIDSLLAAGVPDRRGTALIDHARSALTIHAAELRSVAGLIDDLPARFAALRACGIADTLVHGDFHPGNVRAHSDAAALLDWGDSFVGHPAFDVLRLVDGASALEAKALAHSWCGRWRAHVPGCAPERAIELLRPVTPLRHAAAFADMCAHIEPTERPYHSSDVPRCLEDAAALWSPLR
jgi:hypothetical protein